MHNLDIVLGIFIAIFLSVSIATTIWGIVDRIQINRLPATVSDEERKNANDKYEDNAYVRTKIVAVLIMSGLAMTGFIYQLRIESE